jgi:hypothetical protein
MADFKARPIRSNFMDDYWLEFYENKGHCSLCGNTGIIDTSDATTPARFHVGRKNFCICPNGQSIRKQRIKNSGDRKILP